MKRAALYCRVSTVDQHPETQLGEPGRFHCWTYVNSGRSMSAIA